MALHTTELNIMQTTKEKMSTRTNTQITISFAQDETELLDHLDEIKRKTHYTRSGWVKEQIRKSHKAINNENLVGV